MRCCQTRFPAPNTPTTPPQQPSKHPQPQTKTSAIAQKIAAVSSDSAKSKPTLASKRNRWQRRKEPQHATPDDFLQHNKTWVINDRYVRLVNKVRYGRVQTPQKLKLHRAKSLLNQHVYAAGAASPQTNPTQTQQN